MIRFAVILTLLSALTAQAHRLVLFVSVAEGEIIVETKFDNGNPPQSGTIQLLDAAEQELLSLPVDPSGKTRIPVISDFISGVVINVKTAEGHEDYWVITPDDLMEGTQ